MGGILLILVIVSITGISLPEKTLLIEEPYEENDPSRSVCVTFLRNAEKHWVDEVDPDRTGAQYDGVIFNNMSSTVITDWNFSISVPQQDCSVDPGPWNGTFTLAEGALNVKKPHEGDKENILLPKEIARELTAHPDRTLAKEYPNVTVLFTDIVGFTKISGEMTAEEVVTMLNKIFTLFDERAQREGIEKIKTIGDAYMAATGLTQEQYNDGAFKMLRFAKGLLSDVQTFNETSPVKLLIRLGINSGPVVAGVIGKTKFIYDIWGDTVNVASRMESTGLPMRIHVTETTKAQTSSLYQYSKNMEIDVKGKGMMKTYFL